MKWACIQGGACVAAATDVTGVRLIFEDVVDLFNNRAQK